MPDKRIDLLHLGLSQVALRKQFTHDGLGHTPMHRHTQTTDAHNRHTHANTVVSADIKIQTQDTLTLTCSCSASSGAEAAVLARTRVLRADEALPVELAEDCRLRSTTGLISPKYSARMEP